MSLMERTVDYRPLTDPVDRHDVDRYRAATRARGGAPGRVGAVVVVVVVVGVAVASVSTTILGLIGSLGSEGSAAGAWRFLTGSGSTLLVAAGMAVVSLILLRRAARPRWEARYRMHRFAEANGMRYDITSPAPDYPGAIFHRGSGRGVRDHLRTVDGRYLDIGTYRYTTGSGKNRRTHEWGFLALHLDRALPHTVLDSTSNNLLFGASNLPTAFDRDQVLSLEGDFDRHFTLYCPTEYERDALYVFTPDLMALLIDEAAPFDVEIVDRWMLVYSSRPFPLADPATYRRLLRIVTTVGEKTLSQTDRYRDERVGEFDANRVAPAGRRLRAGVPWAAILTTAGFVAIWIALNASRLLE